jgi:predicted neuraminidase
MKIIDRKFLNITTHSCHASTIAFYNDKPIYAWFGGSREGAPDVAIYIQCDDKLYTWQITQSVPMWNPILFPYKDKLFLFAKSGVFCDKWTTFMADISNILNDDFDIKKCNIQMLPAGLNGPVKTKAIIDGHGFIHCGSSVETIYDWTAYEEVYTMENNVLKYNSRSEPLTVPKKTYTHYFYGKRTTTGVIQPSLWIDKNHNINAFFRSSTGLGKIYHSVAKYRTKHDYLYEKWTEPKETHFDNPNSGVDTVYFNGRLFLVYNPSQTNRCPLNLVEINNDFEIINEVCIEDKIDSRSNTNELSYPYLIEWDSKLHLVYTYGRSKIENVTIAMD